MIPHVAKRRHEHADIRQQPPEREQQVIRVEHIRKHGLRDDEVERTLRKRQRRHAVIEHRPGNIKPRKLPRLRHDIIFRDGRNLGIRQLFAERRKEARRLDDEDAQGGGA